MINYGKLTLVNEEVLLGSVKSTVK